MAVVTLTVDGRKIQAQPGLTVLEAAEANGIHIPVLCHHPALPPEGACRICLVEIQGQRNLQTSCTFPISEGMVVQTQSPRVVGARKFVLELLISEHPLDCMTCDATGACELQNLTYEYGVKGEQFADAVRHTYPVDDPNPFIQVDRNKCILCRRCVRACNYVNGVEAIGIAQRGIRSHIAFGMDSTMQDSPCEFCGSCMEVCPTGALWPKMSLGKGRPWQLRQVQTTCSYCGVGCQLTLHVRDHADGRSEIVRVSGEQGPANHGFTCVKGRFGYDYVNHADRLSKPLVRKYLLEGREKRANSGLSAGDLEFVEVGWDEALDLVARKFADVKRQSGGDAFAALASARCTNEENYLTQKLARQVMGTHNIDHCARL